VDSPSETGTANDRKGQTFQPAGSSQATQGAQSAAALVEVSTRAILEQPKFDELPGVPDLVAHQ
jgi:hypothetical protein